MTEAWWVDWIPTRAFLALMALFILAHLVYVPLVNREILLHRAFPGKGTETWDSVWMGLFIPMLLAIGVVASQDNLSARALLPLWVWPIGLVFFVLGGGLFLRAMGDNPFFEKTVRIQSERGHHVIGTGPYRTVRHPGYLGMLVWILSFPLLLISSRALLPTALAMVGLVIRTVLEDRMLQKKLPGYADYAARVRSRLIPGVW